ncbi:MAG: M15 family metallopeptidase [Tepidiformaceae bacterium]
MVDASRPAKRGNENSESSESRNPWLPIFVVALAVVALSFVLLLFVVADKLGGDPEPTPAPTGAAAEATASPTGEAAASTTASTTTAPVASATAVALATVGPGGADTTPLLACNNILVPLDKNHRLGADCEPGDLVAVPGSASVGGTQLMRAEAKDAFVELVNAAGRDGFRLFASSSYRSYGQQIETFRRNVAAGGQEYAERTSARAGHSEHQLGTTTDVASISASFEAFNGTPEATWLAQNSWKYGFIVSYPPGTEQVTGYAREDWHIRYLGKGVAQKVHDSGVTLHEYLLR